MLKITKIKARVAVVGAGKRWGYWSKIHQEDLWLELDMVHSFMKSEHRLEVRERTVATKTEMGHRTSGLLEFDVNAPVIEASNSQAILKSSLSGSSIWKELNHRPAGEERKAH